MSGYLTRISRSAARLGKWSISARNHCGEMPFRSKLVQHHTESQVIRLLRRRRARPFPSQRCVVQGRFLRRRRAGHFPAVADHAIPGPGHLGRSSGSAADEGKLGSWPSHGPGLVLAMSGCRTTSPPGSARSTSYRLTATSRNGSGGPPRCDVDHRGKWKSGRRSCRYAPCRCASVSPGLIS